MRRTVLVSVLATTALAAGCKSKDEGPAAKQDTAAASVEAKERSTSADGDGDGDGTAVDDPLLGDGDGDGDGAPAQLSPSAATIADEIDASRYEADLRFVAAARPPGSSHWRAVRARCTEVFEAAGFSTSSFEAEGAGISVIGHKPGTDPALPGVVIGAHYDHIDGCAGADDNASGTAAVLELARVLGAHEWEHELTVACWDEEESGLNGSREWIDAAVAEGRSFALYLNFDAMAYADSTPGSQTLPPGSELMFSEQIEALKQREFRADFIAILADSDAHEASSLMLAHAERLELPAALLELPSAVKNGAVFAELRRSDHASFWEHDIPAVFLSDTANFRTDTYHCLGRPDTVETLDLAFATKVVRAAAGGIAERL